MKAGGPQDGSGEARRKHSLGKAGESVARRYLEANGYRIIETNYRRRGGEVDIVAFKDRTLVFCEVKTRIGAGDAVESYSETQQRRMVRVSQLFLLDRAERLPKVFDLRYDLIVIGEGEDGILEVKEHMADAFRPA